MATPVQMEFLLSHRWFIREEDPIDQISDPNCPPGVLKKVVKAYEENKLKELKSRYFYLRSVKFKPKNVCSLTYYLKNDMLDEILSEEYPSDLAIEMTDGSGNLVKKIVLRGVEFKEHVADYNLDYRNTDVLEHTVNLKYKTIKWE